VPGVANWRNMGILCQQPDESRFTMILFKTRPGLTCKTSKLKLECQLDRSRSANLIQRIETAIRAAGPQTVRQRLRRVAEQGAG